MANGRTTVGSIDVRFDANASGVEREAKKAERAIEGVGDSVKGLDRVNNAGRRAAQELRREYEKAFAGTSQASNAATRKFLANADNIIAKNEIAVGRLQAGDIKRLLSRQKIARQIEAIENKIASRSDRGLDTSAQEQQLNDLRQRQRVAIIEQRNADDQRIKDINTFVQGTDKALGNFRKMAQVEGERSEKSQRDLAKLQIDALKEDEKRTRDAEQAQRRLAKLQIDALKEDEKRTRSLTRLQVQAGQEDERRTRNAEQAQRRLTRLHIEALKEDEKRTQQANKMARSTRRTTSYLGRQLRALRDFFVRYSLIIALFAAPAAAAGLAGASITAGEDFIVRQRQLEALIGTYGSFAVAQERIRDIADSTRTSFRQTSDIFETLFLQFRDMPYAIEQTAAVTEGINLLFRASAASAEEAGRAIVQLRQGFAKGVFSAQDVRIITEQIRQFDDLLRAAGLPIGQSIEADRLAVALSGGAGRQLVEERAAAIDSRLSLNAQRIADTFARVSAEALKTSGFLGVVNKGLEYFEALISDQSFEDWLTSVYQRGIELSGALVNFLPTIIDAGKYFADLGISIVGAGVRLVDAFDGVARFFVSVVGYFSAPLLYLGGTIVGVAASFALLRGVIGAFTAIAALVGTIASGGTLPIILGAITAAAGIGAGLYGASALGGSFGGADADEISRLIQRNNAGIFAGRDGTLRYSALDAALRERARQLGKEESAVLSLTQSYRVLDKEYGNVANASRRLTYSQRFEQEIEKVAGTINRHRTRLGEALGGQVPDNVLDTILGINLDDIDSVEELGRRLQSLAPNVFGLDYVRVRGGGYDYGERFAGITVNGERIDTSGDLVEAMRLIKRDLIQSNEELGRVEGEYERFLRRWNKVLTLPDQPNLATVDQSQFDAITNSVRFFYQQVLQVENQILGLEFSDTFEEAVKKVEADRNQLNIQANKLANARLKGIVETRRERLQANLEIEQLAAIGSDDQTKVKAAEAALKIFRGEVTADQEVKRARGVAEMAAKELAEATQKSADALKKVNDAQVALNRARLQNDEALKKAANETFVKAKQEYEKALEDEIIADKDTLKGLEKRAANTQKLYDLIVSEIKGVETIEQLRNRLLAGLRKLFGLKLEDELKKGGREDAFSFDFIDVLAQRALGQQVDTEQNRLDFLSQFGGLNARRRAQLENDLFLRQQQAAARLALESSKRIFGSDSDEVKEAANRLEKINEALSGQNPLVRQNIEAWTQARIAQLEFADEQERINTGLNNLARVSQFAVESLRDGFITAIDEAERFSDVLHSIALGLRNLILDIAVFEPLERGLRSVLQNNFLNTVIPGEGTTGPPLNKLTVGGGQASGGTIRQDIYQTNVMPPDIAVAYQRQFASYAVAQGQQLAENPYASGL